MLILFAVGGTGGHIFPAQALADELLEHNPRCRLLFAGAGLKLNRFLDKSRFQFEEVMSATPFRRNIVRAFFLLLKGVYQSLKLLRREKPDLVIGFGSYHSFPLLLAAKLCRIPIVLFEADSIPGKVNRLFSRYARFTAVHFPTAAKTLKGISIPVIMPNKHHYASSDVKTSEEARAILGLDPHHFTLFVFGGSQGARGINDQILPLLSLLKTRLPHSFQLIHVTGNEKTSALITKMCQELHLKCYVKDFEPHMSNLWKAATLVIGRSGASTFSEIMHFEVPGILIPYPHASEAHQHANARFLEKEVQGGICLEEKELTPDVLCRSIFECEKKLEYYKESIRHYRTSQRLDSLGKVIYEHFAFHEYREPS